MNTFSYMIPYTHCLAASSAHSLFCSMTTACDPFFSIRRAGPRPPASHVSLYSWRPGLVWGQPHGTMSRQASCHGKWHLGSLSWLLNADSPRSQPVSTTATQANHPGAWKLLCPPVAMGTDTYHGGLTTDPGRLPLVPKDDIQGPEDHPSPPTTTCVHVGSHRA